MLHAQFRHFVTFYMSALEILRLTCIKIDFLITSGRCFNSSCSGNWIDNKRI